MSSNIFDLSDLKDQLLKCLSVENDNIMRKQLVNSYLEKVDLLSKTTVNDFRNGLEWMNVKEPLSLKTDLKGKIVILDFFTYCCINCMHILPDLKALEHQFPVEDGLVVVGVHSPKFSNEKETVNIASAVERYEILHPVVNDSEETMWRALGVCFWPTLVVLGPNGNIILELMGEGHRQLLELFLGEATSFYKKKGELSAHALPQIRAKERAPATCVRPLLYPGKVAVAQGAQLLAVADTGHHRIIVTDIDGRVQHVIGGLESGFHDGKFSEARFHSVQGIAFRTPSLLYVADTENHAIREIDLIAGQVRTLVGTGEQGHDSQSGKIWTAQVISSPWDVCLVNENVLLIAMAGTHQIWALFLEDTVWWKNRKYLKGVCAAIAGSGREENRNNNYPMSAAFAQPSGLALSTQLDCVFIADSESSAVRKIELAGGQVLAVAGGVVDPKNLFGFGDVDGRGVDAKLQHPLCVAWSETTGRVYVADSYNHKLKCIDPSTKECTTFVDSASKPIKFNEPGGLCANGDKLFVADTNNHQVVIVNLKTKSISTLPIQLDTSGAEPVEQMPVCEQSVAIPSHGGLLLVKAKITLPQGASLTNGAPSKWKVILPPDVHWSIVNEDQNEGSEFKTSAEWMVKVVPTEDLVESKSCLIINCIVFLCVSNTCTSRSATFKINVSFNAPSATETVTCEILHDFS